MWPLSGSSRSRLREKAPERKEEGISQGFSQLFLTPCTSPSSPPQGGRAVPWHKRPKLWEGSKGRAVRALRAASHLQRGVRHRAAGRELFLSVPTLRTRSLTRARRPLLNTLGRSFMEMQTLAHVPGSVSCRAHTSALPSKHLCSANVSLVSQRGLVYKANTVSPFNWLFNMARNVPWQRAPGKPSKLWNGEVLLRREDKRG